MSQNSDKVRFDTVCISYIVGLRIGSFPVISHNVQKFERRDMTSHRLRESFQFQIHGKYRVTNPDYLSPTLLDGLSLARLGTGLTRFVTLGV